MFGTVAGCVGFTAKPQPSECHFYRYQRPFPFTFGKKKASRKMATLLWVKIAQSRMKFDSFRKRGKRTLNPPPSLSSHLGWRVDWLCCVYVLTTPPLPFPPGGSTLCHLACHLSFAFQPFTRTANQNDSVCVCDARFEASGKRALSREYFSKAAALCLFAFPFLCHPSHKAAEK